MMKWIAYLVLAALLAGTWIMHQKKGQEMADLRAKITAIEEAGDPDSQVQAMEGDFNAKDGERTMTGILITFLGAGVAGIFIVAHLLPFFAQRITHAVYDSAEMVEKDFLHDARSLTAQGDYEGAIAAYREAAAAEPLNRLPWVEIAKIQKTDLEDPYSAIETIRYAIESQAWEVNDAAYFLFRLAELYDEVEANRESAVAIMNQVIEQFPETRHSANARNKLHEWEVQDAAARGHA
jgi:tetratricopeptide (TPR) repeat protein